MTENQNNKGALPFKVQESYLIYFQSFGRDMAILLFLKYLKQRKWPYLG